MIVRFSIVGTITTHFESITEIVNSILPEDVVLKAKVRVIGEEINAVSERMNMYLYRINQNNFQLESNFNYSIRSGLVFLDRLAYALQKENISYVFEYYLSDSHGNNLTKEKSRSFLKVET